MGAWSNDKFTSLITLDFLYLLTTLFDNGGIAGLPSIESTLYAREHTEVSTWRISSGLPWGYLSERQVQNLSQARLGWLFDGLACRGQAVCY